MLLPPLVFRHLDEIEAALWFVLITLQGLQLVFETSFGQTFGRAFGYSVGGATHLGDLRKSGKSASDGPNVTLLAQTWSTGRPIYLAIGVVTLLGQLALALWSSPVLIAQSDDQGVAWAAITVFAAGSAIRAVGGLQASYLFGVGRIAILRWSETVFSSASFVGALVALKITGDLFLVALWYQLPLALGVAWNAELARRHQEGWGGFRASWRLNRDITAQLWPRVWRSGLGLIIYQSVTQGAGLYYARIGDPTAVAAFLLAMSIVRPLGQFAQVPFHNKLPELALLQARGTTGVQIGIVEPAMRLSYFLYAFLVVVITVLLPYLTPRGDSGAVVEESLWLLIGLAGFFERVGGMHLQLYSVTNHIVWHWANGVAGFLFIVFVGLGLGRLGVYAFPASQVGALLLWYVPLSVGLSYRAFYFRFPHFEARTSLIPGLILLMAFTFSIL